MMYQRMRALLLSLLCGFSILLAGCGKEAAASLSFHLSDQDQGGTAIVPTSAAALVVTQVETVASEATQRRITIKLLPADASIFEKLTKDNSGKTLIIVLGRNVLATQKISQPVPAWAAINFALNTNLDFEGVYPQILKLSKQFMVQ